MANSKRFRLNKEDLIKILIGLCIAMAGAGLTYLTDIIANVDFGEYTPMAVAGWSVIVNLVRKLISK